LRSSYGDLDCNFDGHLDGDLVAILRQFDGDPDGNFEAI
jgi:hypothetical protein